MKLLASKAGIWSRCPASTSLPKAKSLDNDSRTEGIERHDRMEKALTITGWNDEGEFEELLSKIEELYLPGTSTAKTFVELELKRVFSEGFDKADIIIDDGEIVTIIDSKFGFVEVPAIDNRQLLSYAIGYHNKIGKVARHFRLMIYQPSANGHPTFKEWHIPKEEFLEYFALMSRAATAAKESEAQVTGDHCKYCPSKLFCGSYLVKARGIVEVENENPTPGSTYDMDLEGIAAGYEELSQKVKILKQLEKAYEEQIILALRSGKPAGDWNLTRTKGKRFWKADIEQLKTFEIFSGVKLTEEKPVSITEARKNKEFKEQIESFMEVSSGSEKLVKINKEKESKEIFK